MSLLYPLELHLRLDHESIEFPYVAPPVWQPVKPAPGVRRPTCTISASSLLRLVVLPRCRPLPLSRATPSRWTPLALSVFLQCVGACLLTPLWSFLLCMSLTVS